MSIVESYDYRDENRELKFQTCRTEDKEFPQRKPDGNGGWEWSLNGVRRVLYRLPELLESDEDPVFIVAGEKDVDNLREIGFKGQVTTNPGGEGKWNQYDDYGQYLEGRHVVILPDNDEPGRDHAQEVAEDLHGRAASVRVLELPDLPESGDVSDWIEDGGTKEELLELARNCDEWEPEDDKKQTSATFAGVNDGPSSNNLQGEPEPNLPEEPEPAQEFPIHVFPGPASKFTVEKAKAVGTNKSLVAPFVFGTMAAAIGASCEVDIKNQWEQSTNLYLITVCPSGVGKSPAKKGATAPIKKRHRDLKEQNERNHEQYEQAQNAEHEERTPKEPPKKKAFVNDLTTEGIGGDLQNSPRGICLMLDEASKWTRDMNKFADGSDREFYLSAWDRDPIETSRKEATEISVDNPHLSVLGALVPSSLQHLTPPGENEEDGFIPRVLFVYPEVEETGMTFAEVTQETLQEYRRFVGGLFNLEPDESPHYDPFEGMVGTWEPRRIPLSTEAREYIQAWYNGEMVPEKKQTENPLIRSFLSKLQNHVFRFALILQVSHDINRGDEPTTVNEKNAERATGLAEFFLSNFRRTMKEMSLQASEGDQELKRYVLDKAVELEEENDQFTQKDLFDKTRSKKEIGAVEDLERIVERLEQDRCLGLEYQPSTGGRPPSPKIKVNPKVVRKRRRSGGDGDENDTSATSAYPQKGDDSDKTEEPKRW